MTERGFPTAQECVAYGCTFRPDQVHNYSLRGPPPSLLTRAGKFEIAKCKLLNANFKLKTGACCLFILQFAICIYQFAIALLFRSFRHRHRLNHNSFARFVIGVGGDSADGANRGQRFFVGRLAEGRVLSVQVRSATQADKKLRSA